MTNFLKDALKASKGLSNTEVMKSLKSAYISKRQIGASEAIYRINSAMKLKDSNLKCTFVATGFPENRWTMFRKLPEEEEEQVILDPEDGEQADTVHTHDGTIEIPGRTGKFQETITVHDRYKNRPGGLEEMSLAQFATIFESRKSVPKETVFRDGMSEDEGLARLISNRDIIVPRYIKLIDEKLGYMAQRSNPCILRLHNSKKKEGHEQHYAEMMLYLPWRDEETDLKRFDPVGCEALFSRNKSIIMENKQGIFPNSGIIEAMEMLEEEGLLRPQHLYETLDLQGNQQNEDDMATEEKSGDFAGLDPDLLETQQERPGSTNESFKYRQITVEEDQELREITRQLVPEQQLVLNEVLHFCKASVLARDGHCEEPQPKLLIVHGGAGKQMHI